MQGYHVSIPSESQRNIPHCYLECDTRQDSLDLTHICGVTFRNRKDPKYPVLSMTDPHIRVDIPVTSETGGSTKASTEV